MGFRARIVPIILRFEKFYILASVVDNIFRENIYLVQETGAGSDQVFCDMNGHFIVKKQFQDIQDKSGF